MNNLNFVSIDFETMTPNLTSACAVGLVKVIDGVVSQKFYSLIKPIPDERTERNTFVHGITDEMVEQAPTFMELFPLISMFIGNLPLVCHNSSTDMNVLFRCMEYYQLTGFSDCDCVDTYALYGRGLKECCDENGILFRHHDALEDAEACAKLYLCYHGSVCQDMAHYDLRDVMANKEQRSYVHDTLIPLSDDEVENKETIFYKSKVVITGVFENFPNRNELGAILKELGADVDTSISSKTNIVLIGQGAGPSKLKKIEDLNAKGKNIRIIYETELCNIMEEIKK